MKSLNQLSLLSFLFTDLFLSSSVNYKLKKEREPQYYVVIAWENGDFTKDQPVVTDVIYATGNLHNHVRVSNQLNDYYKAYFSKSRGTYGLNKSTAFSFETKDQAELKRREIIEGLCDWKPLFLTQFSVLCDD